MLFIPAGWWHFVFSEEPNPETHINFAINFWKISESNWDDNYELGSHDNVPYSESHNLKIDPGSFLKGPISVTKSETNFFHAYEDDEEQITEMMTYEDFLKLKDPFSYILELKCAELEKYAPQINKALFSANIWLNFGNVCTSPHYDGYDNWLYQIQGRKRVILFPPCERDKLYPVNRYSLNLIKRLAKIYRGEFILERNDVLYPTFIKTVLQEPIRKYIPFNEMSHTFYCIIELVKNNLQTENSIVPTFSKPTVFSVIDVRNSEYCNNNYRFPYYTILWFLTTGKLYIRSTEFVIKENSCYAFPTSFLYPWKVQGAVFVMPE
jgi:hypothetical protein